MGSRKTMGSKGGGIREVNEIPFREQLGVLRLSPAV